jgi:MFS family permease
VIATGAFLGGACFSIFAAQWDSTMQRQVPREVLSRVSAYDWFGSTVFMPLGFAIVGPVASVVGVHAVFIIGSVYIVVAVAVAMFVPSIRHMGAGDLQQEPPPAFADAGGQPQA